MPAMKKMSLMPSSALIDHAAPGVGLLQIDEDDEWSEVQYVNTIGAAFNSDTAGKVRIVLGICFGVVCCLLILPPLMYLLYYCLTNGGLHGFNDQIGFHIQPIVLANKAKKGGNRFDEIKNCSRHKMFLGAQPDLFGGFKSLFSDNNIRTVVSLNSRSERQGNLWMRPPTDREYESHNVKFVKFTLPDHSLVDRAMLDNSADAIRDALKVGDVYIHCKAGQGRSAQAVLAYLVKHEEMKVDDAILQIRDGRPGITLRTTDEFANLREDKRIQAQERHDMFASFIGTAPKPVARPVLGAC